MVKCVRMRCLPLSRERATKDHTGHKADLVPEVGFRLIRLKNSEALEHPTQEEKSTSEIASGGLLAVSKTPC